MIAVMIRCSTINRNINRSVAVEFKHNSLNVLRGENEGVKVGTVCEFGACLISFTLTRVHTSLHSVLQNMHKK